MIRFSISDVCTAFKDQAIGSKVVDIDRFIPALEKAVQETENRVPIDKLVENRAPGQYFVPLPKEVYDTVSAGDGPKSDNPDDYIVRHHREGPKMYLKREKAGEVQFLAVVVYTRAAYLADPDLTEEEKLKVEKDDATHYIVAVIASSGPESPVTPFRFVHNLAGGNNEYLLPDPANGDTTDDYVRWAEFITKKAKEVLDYWNNYSVVAD